MGLLNDSIYKALSNHSVKLPWEEGPAKQVFYPRSVLACAALSKPYFPGLLPGPSPNLEAPEDRIRQDASMDVLPLYSHQLLCASAVRLRDEDCLAPRSSDTCVFKRWLCLPSHAPPNGRVHSCYLEWKV